MTRERHYPKRPLRFRAMNLLIRLAPGEKYYHNSILFRRGTAGFADTAVDTPYEFSVASDDDIHSIRRHAEALPDAVYHRRIAHGDRCYCLKQDGNIVSYNWVRFSNCCVLCGFGRELPFHPLAPGQAYSYDFYTYTAHRGAGLGEMTKKAVIRALARDGITELYAVVAPHNIASMKIHLRLGYQPVHMVYGYRLKRWCRTCFGRDADMESLQQWITAFTLTQGVTRHD